MGTNTNTPANLRESLIDLITKNVSGTYHCTRVWYAWGVGTMSQHDFHDVGESDTPAELADSIIAMLDARAALPAQAVATVADEPAAEVISEGVRGVRFTESVNYGMDLPVGTKLYACPAPAQDAAPIRLQRMAVAEDGVLRWMSGRGMPAGIDAVELYAMPDFGRAPDVLYASAPQADVQTAPTGAWSLGDIEGNWRDIDHTSHGGVMRIVWRMEDDERSPACEAKAHAVVAALNAAAQVAAQRADLLKLRDALQFYARGDHFMLSDKDAWDTVSGEPQNLWCDEAGTATVEDGSIAKAALAAQTQGDAV